ncbi:hypothetical protein EBR21_08070 [bacterium]|nr:hypothetical protein [bacterium]
MKRGACILKFQLRWVWVNAAICLTLTCIACGRSDKRFGFLGDDNPKDDSENFIVPSLRAKIVPIEKVSFFSFAQDKPVVRVQKSLRGISTGYSAQSFAQGDVLVIPPSPMAPQGAIRIIVEVKDGPGEVFLASEPATLTEAVSDAYVICFALFGRRRTSVDPLLFC